MRRRLTTLTIALVLSTAVPRAEIAAAAGWSSLGRDRAGDVVVAHIDLLDLSAKRKGSDLAIRFLFSDLPSIAPPTSDVIFRYTLERGVTRSACCEVRAEFSSLFPSTFTKLPCREEDDECERIPIESAYDAQASSLTVLVPLRLMGARAGDLMSGCGFSDDERRFGCEPGAASAISSAEIAADQLVTRAAYAIPRTRHH